jgi:hypothetical protein
MSRPHALDQGALDGTKLLPAGEAQRDAIHRQLERILSHPHFKHSKRYPNLLRYVVEHTLRGDSHLKERTLGVEVFGRDPDYDTNEDPVVRVTAGEIRKRIAQYYHEPGHESEIRIDLPAGSYAPEFHLPADRSWIDVDYAHNGNITIPAQVPARTPIAKRTLVYLLLVILAGAAAIGTARVKAWVSPRPIDDFWGPVLDSPAPSLVAIGEPNSLEPPKSPDISVSDHIYSGDRITFSDANALFRLAVLLGGRGKPARLQTSMATTLTDMRQGPAVLIAGFDNEWTVRATSSLRYHFAANPPDRVFWIEDRANPSRRDWQVDFREKYSQLTQDYAIVSRFYDATTGQPVVIAAGLGENGTIAAGEFLTDAHEMENATKNAPKDWRTQNVEFVLATQVINERSGCPRVLATYFWPAH